MAATYTAVQAYDLAASCGRARLEVTPSEAADFRIALRSIGAAPHDVAGSCISRLVTSSA